MKRLSGEDKAGLYITVIVHLTVIIILLLFRIGAVMKGEQSFVIDFTREEAMEKEKAEEKFSEAISQRIDELIAGESGVAFRNVASDRSQLKDDRGTDAEELYKEAERLAKELRDGVVADEPEDDYVPVAPDPKKSAEKKPAAEYSGPSVVSYSLDGRKASKLPIPAYRCYGGGMVTVIIIVDNAGNVVSAKVQDAVSSTDKCLREFAVRAARLSKFSSDPHAPARQTGDIVYQFLAQ
ncbi:MAG: hypothetical protein J5498_00360 [Bacteroidales bacterium]|nr:hypothetical protein [Bacteroidales bacterium]MBR4408251.1 hypothetical protein [Bacteroidales bacterium]